MKNISAVPARIGMMHVMAPLYMILGCLLWLKLGSALPRRKPTPTAETKDNG